MFKNHPKGLPVLFFTEMWERFGFYLMLGIFVLYMEAGMDPVLAAKSGLALPPTHKQLADRVYADKLKQALEETTGRKLLLAFEVGTAAEASLAARERREREEERARNETAFRAEPFVRDVLERFDATIRPDSIKPVS